MCTALAQHGSPLINLLNTKPVFVLLKQQRMSITTKALVCIHDLQHGKQNTMENFPYHCFLIKDNFQMMPKSGIIRSAVTGQMRMYVTQDATIICPLGVTSGPTPQVASSAAHMSTQANKERKIKKIKNIERDSNSGRLTHNQCV